MPETRVNKMGNKTNAIFDHEPRTLTLWLSDFTFENLSYRGKKNPKYSQFKFLLYRKDK